MQEAFASFFSKIFLTNIVCTIKNESSSKNKEPFIKEKLANKFSNHYLLFQYTIVLAMASKFKWYVILFVLFHF